MGTLALRLPHSSSEHIATVHFLPSEAERRPLEPAAGTVCRGTQALVMLNRYPYNNGHVMVAPRRHVGSPELLSREERTTLSDLVALAVERLRVALSPAAFNLGANLGGAAGAGFADHLHWHVVPRWEGDTNFMPVVASTRVLSQHLAESYALLVPHFKAIETALF